MIRTGDLCFEDTVTQTLLSILEMHTILLLRTMSAHSLNLSGGISQYIFNLCLGIPIFQWYLNVSLIFTADLAHASVLVALKVSDDSQLGRLTAKYIYCRAVGIGGGGHGGGGRAPPIICTNMPPPPQKKKKKKKFMCAPHPKFMCAPQSVIASYGPILFHVNL